MKKICADEYYGISIVHFNEYVSPEFFNNPQHRHDHCEIFIHLKGEMDVFVESSSYHISKNCVRIYNSNELHYGRCSYPQLMEWYQISIPYTYFTLPSHSPAADIFYNRKSGDKNVFSSSYMETMSLLLEETFLEYENGNPLWQLYFQSTVTKILCVINEKSNSSYFLTNKNEALQEIINVIYSDFQSISTIEDLSKLTNFSVSYIHKLFKEALNITPHRFICDRKLYEARKFLQKGCSVEYACEKAGFNNYTNFITLFKNKFAVTPKKYQMTFKK